MRGIAANAATIRAMAGIVACSSQMETKTFFHEPKKAPSVPSYTIGSSDIDRPLCSDGGRCDARGARGKTDEVVGRTDGCVVEGRTLDRSGGKLREPGGGRRDEAIGDEH
jgi:hypothetical protein